MKRFCHYKTVVLLAIISFLTLTSAAQIWNPQHQVGIASGQYHYSPSQIPGSIVELTNAGVPNTGITYQWEQSLEPINGFAPISGATQSTFTFSSALTQTTYYRRKNSQGALDPFYSNVVKITVVSVNWEDLNYIRTHEMHTKGPTTWSQVDNMTIGNKLQTTTYLDGLGRHIQTVDREAATSEQTLWGDLVQFSQYDVYGRQPQRFLPYSTTNESGKFKTTNQASQAQYYSSVYNETSAFSTIVFDSSPADRVLNVKKPGTSWAASSGNSATYDVNTAADDVQIFTVDYQQGSAPIHLGAFTANKLYKIGYADENGKLVIEFVNGEGQVILKKVQLDNTINHPYNGWICTYNIYDDFGQLRIQIQPEGVKYLVANGWSFTGTNGQLVLSEQCFFYSYDSKGRNIWKKSPGAEPLTMLYDVRDRVVFMQDGNQAAAPTPQWTTNLYDELDRSVISCLYNTSATLFALNLSIAGAPLSTDVTVNNAGTFSVSAKLSLSPLGEAVLNNTTATTILSYQFYDNYGYNSVKAFNNAYNNSEAYGAGLNVMPIVKTQRVTSMVTGSMMRILNSTTFLSSTYYYDERGSQIQSLSDNIKGATNITTLQYHFDGRLLSACSDHSTPNTGYDNYKILTKFTHDKLGRVVAIDKKFGSNSFNTLSEYAYDDLGRLAKKTLDPGYTGNGGTQLEVLDYSYNLHSQITGINKNYALKAGNYDKWGHFFGLYLGYDNRDNQFTTANLNGQVTGTIWNTQGDDQQRKYDYTYDNAGRLTESIFKERKTTQDSWSSSQMDFSVSGGLGKITYDLNGNLLSMLHKGVVPGNPTPIIIDNLSYGYATLSNKLIAVSDLMSLTAVNGKFGDFKDGSNGITPDYVYDNNGNIVIDLNKNAKELEQVTGANGIRYNFLDKPEKIRLAGKGTIEITYLSDGTKLQRKFTSETENVVKKTLYIGEYTYEETTTWNETVITPLHVVHIGFEEGRIRVVTPVSQGNGLDALVIDGNIDLPNSKRGAIDYFIMDYQQSVRMMLSEQVHQASNTCTMETARAALEESIFGQPGTGNEVAITRDNVPSTWNNQDIGDYASRLGTNAGHVLGPNTLQKVMAGDEISATVQYYWVEKANSASSNMVSIVLGSLGSAITGGGGVAGLVKDNVAQITNQLSGLNGFINAVQPNGSNPSETLPEAYLTILFFDERFNFIEAVDGGVVQEQIVEVDDQGGTLNLVGIKAPKNGYAFVYLSNQSDADVYFDNLLVGVNQGNIIEENHFYSYGLKISTLSSRRIGSTDEGTLANNYLFQGAFSEIDEEIGWNAFQLRNYDPQVGRWVQQDPYQQFASPYIGMGSNPVTFIDPNGGSIFDGLTTVGKVGVSMLGGAIIGGFIDVIAGGDGWRGMILGAAGGAAFGMAGLNSQIAVKLGLKTLSIVSTQLGNTPGKQVGGNSTEVHSKQKITNATVEKESVSFVGSVSVQTATAEEGETWYYGYEEGGKGHSVAFRPQTNTIYETNHPDNGTTKGGKSWLKSGPKSQGYQYKMYNEYDFNRFWGFRDNRETLWLAPVYVPYPSLAVKFFESWVGKDWPYDLVSNNCKDFVIQGLGGGGAKLNNTGSYPARSPTGTPYQYTWKPFEAGPVSIGTAPPMQRGSNSNNGGPKNWAKLVGF